MEARDRTWGVLTFAAVAVLGFALTSSAGEVPPELPRPDGKPGDATKPVKVYIMAGQSNMVGFGKISGARCHYAGIYVTADPYAPQGRLSVGRTGYKVKSHGVYQSAAPDSKLGAIASIYDGAYDSVVDYDKLTPAKTEGIALGVAHVALPSVDGPHTVVVRAFIDVPESGNYLLSAGFDDSSYAVAELDGREVYRRDVGEEATRQKVTLSAEKRYAIKITYAKGGSAALWLTQRDMVGKGDLMTVVKKDGKFQHLIDDEGKWTVRNDVYFQDARIPAKSKGSQLSATSNGKTFGPELGFGHVIGEFHDAQVLLIKTAMGNRALGFDFRPPSSGRTDPSNKWESLEYKLMIKGVRMTLDNIAKVVPGYKDQGYEIVGFVWWQGHRDQGKPQAEYEQHLVNLINDVRAEFDVPTMRAVIATIGFGGHKIDAKGLEILKAQLAISDPIAHPEFAGTVASVDTRDFWRDYDDSPSGAGYHYNHNAETYLLTGDALGRAMVGLLKDKK